MADNARFHNKLHRKNHHSIQTPGYPDSATDPIASTEEPFEGDMVVNATVSAQNLWINTDAYVGRNTTIMGNLCVYGADSYFETYTTVTSSMSVINHGTGPALTVKQTGPEPIARFLDGDATGSENALLIADTGQIVINADRPTLDRRVTISGSITASGNTEFQGGSATSFRSFAANDAAANNWDAAGFNTGHADGMRSFAVNYNTLATASGSFAQGSTTRATGDYSHAEGSTTFASGSGSHSEGHTTRASGSFSHAEGDLTRAEGDYSHTEGILTSAFSLGSHTEGFQTQAAADYAHAEGNSTFADGNFSHTEGQSTSAFGIYSHAEGLSGRTIGIGAHVEGFSTIAFGNFAHAEGRITYAGNHNSHTEGAWTSAFGHTSHTEGLSSVTFGAYAHAEGELTLAAASGSHAEGFMTVASGTYSHAEGFMTVASGTGTHAEGFMTSAFFPYTHAEGTRTITLSSGAHAEGIDTRAEGHASHASGFLSVARGDVSYAEGVGTLAQGIGSHSEGIFSVADGDYSHAAGYSTRARGIGSYSTGVATSATGDGSYAAGQFTVANGFVSYALGYLARTGKGSSYVWSSSTFDPNQQYVESTRTGQYMVSAMGGVYLPGFVGIGDNSVPNEAQWLSGIDPLLSTRLFVNGGNIRVHGVDFSTQALSALTAASTDGQSLFDLRSQNVGANYSLSIAESGVGFPGPAYFMKFFGGRTGDPQAFINVREGSSLRFGSFSNFYGQQFKEYMRVGGNGNIGIGLNHPFVTGQYTNDPPIKLTVNGAISAHMLIAHNTNSNQVTANNIYGFCDETVFTDGTILSGNGNDTLTMNYTNGIFISSAPVHLTLQRSTANALIFARDSSANLYRSASSTLRTDGNLHVGGNLSAFGTLTYLDTIVSVTSALFIDTDSPETALRVTQRGSGDIIRIEDSPNPDSTPFIIKSNGLVGIGTADPASTLTVVGTISGNSWLSAGNINLQQADVRTLTNPATASGSFLVLNINGTNRAIRLWDFTS